MSGGMCVFSDNLPKLPAERLALLQKAIPWICEEYGIPMPHDPRMERPQFREGR